MKTIKTIMLLGAISLFTSIPYGAVEARDCSNPKGFHANMMCKLQDTLSRSSGSSDSSVTTTTDEAKKENTGFFKKLKSFGGKNIGETD